MGVQLNSDTIFMKRYGHGRPEDRETRSKEAISVTQVSANGGLIQEHDSGMEMSGQILKVVRS